MARARCSAQVGGVLARAESVRAVAGLDARIEEDDAALWAAQREVQEDAVVRVSGLPAELERTLRTVDEAGGSLVGRAGVWWVAGADLPGWRIREPWPEPAPALARLAGRVKARFDPAGVLAPGVAVA